MNSNDEVSTRQWTASRTVAGCVAASIVVFAALLVAAGSSDGEPNNAQHASDDAAPVAGGPEALPFVEVIDPCSLTLPEAIASHGNMADGLQAWSDHLRQIAGSAPEDVAAAVDALATDYASLANAESATLSESTSQVIASAGGNTATTELVDSYLESSCA